MRIGRLPRAAAGGRRRHRRLLRVLVLLSRRRRWGLFRWVTEHGAATPRCRRGRQLGHFPTPKKDQRLSSAAAKVHC